MTKKKKTLGEHILDASTSTEVVSDKDLLYGAQDEYYDNVIWAIRHARKEVSCMEKCKETCLKRDALEGDFFLTILYKWEGFETAGAAKRMYVPIKPCPSPTFSSTVYRYIEKGDTLELIWTLPSEDESEAILAETHSIDKGVRELQEYIRLLLDGTLTEISDTFNAKIIRSKKELN